MHVRRQSRSHGEARTDAQESRRETALITGGARGIGEGLAWMLAKLSTQVVIVDVLPEAVAASGQVDILVNNALHRSTAPMVDLPLDEFEKTYATNARAPFLMIKHLLRGMLRAASAYRSSGSWLALAVHGA